MDGWWSYFLVTILIKTPVGSLLLIAASLALFRTGQPVGRREVRDLILALKADGRTVFFSSHILQDAEMICDRVAILNEGKLRAAGRLSEMIFEVSVRGELPPVGDFEPLSSAGDDHLLKVADVASLARLLDALNGVDCDGRALRVDEARDRPRGGDRPPRY